MCSGSNRERIKDVVETLASLDGHIASQSKLMEMFSDCDTDDNRLLLMQMTAERVRLEKLLSLLQPTPTKAYKLLGINVAPVPAVAVADSGRRRHHGV